MKKILTILGITALGLTALNAKKVLDHSSFDDWKSVRISDLSRNGQWAAYEVNPQEGDGELTLRNTQNGKTICIPRGYKPAFTADSKYAVALIKPFFADTRQAKIDKKKDLDMPQDSLAMINLSSMKITKVPMVTQYKLAKDAGTWLAYESVDTTLVKLKNLKDKEAGKPLVVVDLAGDKKKIIKGVKGFSISDDGRFIGAQLGKSKNDSTSTSGIAVISLPDTTLMLVDRDKAFYGTPVFNRQGSRMAYVASDSVQESGTRPCAVYQITLNGNFYQPEMMLEKTSVGVAHQYALPNSSNPAEQEKMMEALRNSTKAQLGETLFVNQFTEPKYSDNGKRLVIGVAPFIEPDDSTKYDFETAELDIWRWDAPMTPPQEKKNLEKLRKHTLPFVIDDEMNIRRLVTTRPFAKMKWSDRMNGNKVLIADPTDDIISQQWNYAAPEHLSVLDLVTGDITDAGVVSLDNSDLSPMGNYVIKYVDRQYYTVDTKTGKETLISKGIEYPLWDEEQDIPFERQAYGVAGWMQDDKQVLVYDKYDIWALDPTGQKAPVNLTAGDGRKNNRKYRVVKTDPDQIFFTPGSELLLKVNDYSDKRTGYATLKAGKAAAPTMKILDTNWFSQLRKAKDAPVYAFQKNNFSTSPDVYIATAGNFANAKKVTDANPQMKEYSWGKANLVNWYTYSGKPSQGILFTPDDFDASKSYPMMTVFYERSSDELYYAWAMEPSWSWINYAFYVSRGYVVFVPDIHYTAGVPGECAYDYVCSGVEEMCRQYPQIDKKRVGIDGQSWGGYQTAYLVTRTNMFACAGSGAPVANMTSAFGGIRWESGDSRQAQYENGQSRIGRNLWEAPELYIANSPVFHANRVETPLLIMHNDADGAVPWYQGIEMFMALRRLGKPVWMLQYNGEAHNIRARKNRKDITIRLQQFFDHYLMGAPEPRWMKDGLNPLRKGQDMATELIVEEEALSDK